MDAGDAAAGAADQRAEREVQGRQTAPAAGDHEVLPGEQDQPACLLPAARPAAAGVHLALLHAADRPEARHLRPAAEAVLPRRALRRPHLRYPGEGLGGNGLQRRLPRLGQVPVHPRHHRQGDRRGADRADRPVRRLAARLDADGDGHGRPEPAPPDAGAAAGVRRDPVQVSGRTAGLLDHDEHVDDRAAVLHPPPDRPTPAETVEGRRSPPTDGRAARVEPALAAARRGAAERASAPPRPPRKKKKRSGRRR